MVYTNLTADQIAAVRRLGFTTVSGNAEWCDIQTSAKKYAKVVEICGLPDSERKVATPAPSALPAYDFRVTVLEGSAQVGAALDGGTVVSLGKSWRLTEREVDIGARPDWQGRTVQYAYVAR